MPHFIHNSTTLTAAPDEFPPKPGLAWVGMFRFPQILSDARATVCQSGLPWCSARWN